MTQLRTPSVRGYGYGSAPESFLNDQPWCADALCANSDTHHPDAWYPEKGEAHIAREVKEICAACPVRLECLRWAIETRQAFGIFGGMSPNERDDLRNGVQDADLTCKCHGHLFNNRRSRIAHEGNITRAAERKVIDAA